jgi:hypothetical protein
MNGGVTPEVSLEDAAHEGRRYIDAGELMPLMEGGDSLSGDLFCRCDRLFLV